MNELDQLEGLAAQADTAATAFDPVDPNAPPGPQPTNYDTEARGMVDMFGALVTGYAPRTAELWNDAAKTRVAAALVPVMEKYQFSLGAMPCELTLLIVAGPLLYQTSKLVAAQMAEEKAQKPEAKKVQATTGTATKAPTGTPEMPTSPQVNLYK